MWLTGCIMWYTTKIINKTTLLAFDYCRTNYYNARTCAFLHVCNCQLILHVIRPHLVYNAEMFFYFSCRVLYFCRRYSFKPIEKKIKYLRRAIVTCVMALWVRLENTNENVAIITRVYLVLKQSWTVLLSVDSSSIIWFTRAHLGMLVMSINPQWNIGFKPRAIIWTRGFGHSSIWNHCDGNASWSARIFGT